jgi:hypothetical protein
MDWQLTDPKMAEDSLRVNEETLRKAQCVCKMTSWRLPLGGAPDTDSKTEALLFFDHNCRARLLRLSENNIITLQRAVPGVNESRKFSI